MAAWAAAPGAAELDYVVPLQETGRATFYVDVAMGSLPARPFLVDTGSSHLVIDEASIMAMQRRRQAHFVGSLEGTLADGSKRVVPLYRIDRLVIGTGCILREVQAVVIPGTDSFILGLSALRKAAPFSLSMKPPRLHLSHCTGPPEPADTASRDAP
jgi:predicted aspartyl protease